MATQVSRKILKWFLAKLVENADYKNQKMSLTTCRDVESADNAGAFIRQRRQVTKVKKSVYEIFTRIFGYRKPCNLQAGIPGHTTH
jgi:hypothetical protein